MRLSPDSKRLPRAALLLLALNALGPASARADETPAPAWIHATGARILSSATAAGDDIYIGSDDHRVCALDADSGALRWARELTAPVRSRPCVAGANLLVVSGNDIAAVDRADGHVVWSFSPKDSRGVEPADPWDYHQSSPVCAGGTVYYGGGNGVFYALDPGTGAVRFSFATGENAAIRSTAAVADGTVFFGDWNGTLYALDAGDGRLRWKQATLEGAKPYPQFGAAVSALVVREDRLYLGLRNPDVLCLDTATGAVRWRFTADNGSWIPGTPAFAGDTLYITGSDDHKVHALDARTGKQQWACDVGANMFIAPLVAGERVIVGDGDSYAKDAGAGRLHVIDRDSGRLLRTVTVGGNIGASSPLLAAAHVIVGSEDGRVIAYRLADLLAP